MKIVFSTVSVPAIKELVQVGEYINHEYGKILDLKLYNAAAKMTREERRLMTADIEDADLVFVDLMGSEPEVVSAVYIGLDQCQGHVVPYGASGRDYMRLGSFSTSAMSSKKEPKKEKKMDMGKMKSMMEMSEKMGKVIPGRMRDMRNYSLLMKYFKLADYENMLNMIYLLLRDYGGHKELPKPEEPRELEDISLCNPEYMTYYKDYDDFKSREGLDEDKPSIALLFYGHSYPTDTSPIINQVRLRFKEFANVIPIAVSNSFGDDEDKLRKLLIDQIPVELDLIINFMSFRLSAGPMGGDADRAVELLRDADVPYMKPYFMSRRTESEWRKSVQGSDGSEVLISVMLPELDGAIETFPLAAMEELGYNEDFDIEINQLAIIEDRLDALTEKARNYIDLRRKDNKDKKIAIVCYNYPPGEANLLGGAFLDNFESLANILARLKEEGYETSGMTADDLKKLFTAGGLVNSGKYGDYSDLLIRYDDSEYREELMESKDFQAILDDWGMSPGHIMAEDGKFLIPGIVDGNVFIGLQPARSSEDSDKSYHDKSILPHHQYLAFYKYIRDEFETDAIIHLATHGTLEFQKGKECGMSNECYPDILIGNKPHLYIYYLGNPSEATIAKRRSHANIISYQAPVFVPGELYGEYSKLMTLIDNYRQALAVSPQGADEILKDIYGLAAELNMEEDLDLIEAELYRMKSSLIPEGLHILGQPYSREESISYARGILRHSLSSAESIRELMANYLNYDLDDLFDQGKYELIEEVDGLADRIFDDYLEDPGLEAWDLDPELRERIIMSLDYGLDAARNSRQNHELDGIIRVLDGRYNPAKMAGDIYRNPEILPAGYNLYQFDPRLVPTESAYRRGEIIANETLKAFMEEEGKYPRSTAVILWGIESSRTQGETFSQILSYLGVRVKSSGANWSPSYEIIPLEELGRPRIDVTINICGFFRDMFPNLIENLSDVLQELYELDESDDENYFKANSKRIYRYLIEEGYDEDEARDLAVSRIFGPEAGSYGTGLTDIIESKNWEEEEEIGTVFLESLKYVYNRSSHGEDVDNLYKENLKEVEIVSQIRSSNEYEITDLDHYYEFFGGLSKSVEMVRGKKAKMYITDVTRDRIISESVEKSISRGIRTRVLNPKWIDGLLEHDQHGVQTMSDRFENVMGLAATTGSVEQWIYNDLHEKYVEDEELRERLIENNKYAYMDILERMMEYYGRGYWDASDEQIDKIKEVFLELENSVERDF